jgi:glycerol-1-phosphate dehydrogenase [NAD(P)+]
MDFFQQYLGRLDREGGFDCECGRRHRVGIREVYLGEKVLQDLPALLRDRYGRGVRLWVLSDQNTEAAAGARCKELLAGWSLKATVLPGSPKPRPTLELAGKLAGEAGQSKPGLVLAVGSGVISDLGKRVSHELGVPNWCVATAPSVDAYTSGHSVFKTRARHQSIPSTPTEVLFCELPVLATAPRRMFLSGLGDLLGKFPASLDWSLSHLLTGEHICEEAVRVARESALRPLRLLSDRGPGSPADAEVLRTLTDALLTTGLLMQAMESSRPASSAEHTAAHIYELAGLVKKPEMELHGLLVALGSRLTLQAYRSFYDALPQVDIPDRLRSLESETPWEQQLPPEMEKFREHIRVEMNAAETGPAAWQRHLASFEREREQVQRVAAQSLQELDEGIQALRAAGLPFDPQAFGLTPAAAYLPFPSIRLLRNRYNSFWLMHELGAEAGPLSSLRNLLGLG